MLSFRQSAWIICFEIGIIVKYKHRNFLKKVGRENADRRKEKKTPKLLSSLSQVDYLPHFVFKREGDREKHRKKKEEREGNQKQSRSPCHPVRFFTPNLVFFRGDYHTLGLLKSGCDDLMLFLILCEKVDPERPEPPLGKMEDGSDMGIVDDWGLSIRF